MSENGGKQRRIDWSTAEVEGANLKVRLLGDADPGWATRFDGLLSVLDRGSGRWGEIKVSSKAIKVSDVEQGAADDLRHLLEGVLQQLNADAGGEQRGAPAEEETAEDPAAQSDRRLAEVFRGFGEPQVAADGQDDGKE